MRATKFGIAVVAAFVVVAVGASAAQAVNFTAAEYPASISGGQTEESPLTLGFEDGLKAQCLFAGFAGQMSGASPEIKVDPGFFGCMLGSEEAEIVVNECQFGLHVESGATHTWSGKFDVVCPVGKKISITSANCKIEIGGQTGREKIEYHELTEFDPDEVEATFNVTSLTYTKVTDAGSCPLTGTGSLSNGTLSGSVAMTAAKASGPPDPISFGID